MRLFSPKSRLARKLATAAFVVSFLFAVASTGLLLFLEYAQGRRQITAEISELGRTSAPSISLSLWGFNTPLLKAQLDGLAKLPYVSFARITHEDGTLESRDRPSDITATPLSFELIYEQGDTSFELGRLALCPDYGHLRARLVKTGLKILGIQFLFTFAIGLTLFVLFYTFVGRHLEAIAGQAKGLSPTNLDQPIILARAGRDETKNDELDVLTNAMNAMRINLRHSIGELSKADERHRVLFETMHQGVLYYDAKGKIISANPAALGILGVSLDQLLARFPVNAGWEWVHEDRSSFPQEEHPVERALSTARQVTDVVMGLGLPGAEGNKWLSVTATPLFRDGEADPYLVHVTFEDITRKKADEEILHRYEQILSATSDLMSFVDDAYIYRAVNDAYLRAHKKAREDIVGRSVEDLMGRDVFRDRVQEKLDRALGGETVKFQDWFEYPGFGRRYMRVVYHPLRSGETIAGTVVCAHDLTEIKEAESALSASELKYRLLFENMAQGTFYQRADGKVVDFNANALSMFGLTADQFMGKTSFDPHWKVVREDGSPCPPQDHPSMQALKTGTPVSDAVMGVFNPRDNDFRWLSINAIPQFREGESSPFQVFVTMHDITPLRRAKEDLKASHERFLTVLNSMEAFIYVSDLSTHEVLFMNQFMMDHFGSDLTGQICYEAFKSERSACPDCASGPILDQAGMPTEVRVWTSQSLSGRWYINQDRAIKWTSGKYVRLHIATDITDFKQMESNLRQAQKMESIGTLAGGMAHDFNNILSIILGNAELAHDEVESWHPVSHHIKEIRTASLRAKGVIRQLLNFSRKTEYQQVSLDLSRLLRESLSLLRASIPSNIEMRPVIPEGAYHILADPSQIHQVFLNLCTNAYQAMAEAGGTIELYLNQVSVADGVWHGQRPVAPGRYVELTVRDNGPGIPESLVDRIFDPYFTTKEVGQGTGLGLAVVQGIVQGHNGVIHVESRPGQGTAFFILFPAADPDPGIPAAEAEEETEKGGGHILIVDDEPEVASVIGKFLERQGYTVDLESDSVKAAGVLSRKDHGYDLVITDMTMPQMNGLELTEQLRCRDGETPVIICTGHSHLMDDPRNAELNIAAYAMKPVTRTEIVKLVKQVLG